MRIKFYKARNNQCSRRGIEQSGRILAILLFIILRSISGFSQTTALSFSQISTSTDIISPGRGAQQWNGSPWDNSNDPYIPSNNTVPKEWYSRFLWAADLEPGGLGVYTFSVFDSRINAAIDAGQLFSFGVMPMCSGCIAGQITYPAYLHTLMQAEATNSQDWFSNVNGSWIPNWNSPNYIARWTALMNALAAHIAAGSHNGVAYKNAIGYVDIRGYGETGEWNTYPWYGTEPTGRKATDASLRSIIDAVANAFPNNQLVICFGSLDPGNACLTPAATSAYVLSRTNNYGHIGWRRDNLGDPGFDGAEDGNAGILTQWQVAPIGGEPNNDASDVPYGDLPREVTKYHMSYFGNGNWASVNASNATFVANARQASLNSGYRLTLNGGSTTTNAALGSAFNITLNWRNIGIAPVYRSYKTQFELRTSTGTVVWTGNSSFHSRLFLPAGSDNVVTDTYTLNGFAAGTYSLYLILRDSLGYTMPLPLSINGRNTDGSYLLRSNIVVTAGSANQPPVANAGSNQTITLPTSTASLTGSGTDASGTITSYAWTKSSGPAGGTISSPTTANTNITGLVQGVYVYKLLLTDNLGDTGSATVQITVNPAVVNQPPVANAGSNQTITLPTSTVSLTGSGTDASGTISSYAWTKSSGPTGSVMSSPATANTNITGLIQGVYVFKLTVKDNLGDTGSATVQITVNPAVVNQPPVANAGSNQTITLPTSTVSLTGSGTDASGTITTYAWTKSSGPSGGTISSPATANTNITGLIQGVYVYKLLLTDNLGDTGSATVQITVNPAVVNQPPVAKAGPDQTITLPTNSVTLNGSASSDPDGTIASYLWTKISGPAQFNIVNNTSANTIVNNLTAGSYSFQLKVTDNGGAIAMDTIKIIVNSAPVNQPPVANAGANISITLPTNVANLNGSASTDPDGTISAYAWTEISGPSTATIAAATSANTAISGLVQGSYVFSLKVTDNGGATNADSITVTVNPAPNIPPVANAGTSKTITLPTNSTNLDGSLSSDPDGSIVSYSWAQISGPSTSTILGGTLSIATATNMVAGVYTFQLTVTDNSGASTKANVKITVNNSGAQPPVANAGADQTITLPTNSVTIDGSGSSASSGNIVSYVWTEKSGPSTVSLSNTAKNTLNNLQAGVYVFALTVTDNNNATGTDSVIITVNPAANIPPVANPGSSISLTLPTNSTTLNGTGSYDPDGTISSYSWTRVSGPNTPAASGANTATLSLSGLIAGQYSYRLTVTDNSGASSSALVNIIVAPAANIPPVANAGANQTITAPANSVILNGSSSYDPDGTITTYNWVTVSGPGSITINNSNTATPSVVGLQPGVYTFQLTVTDNNGATASDQVFVTVLPQVVLPNQAPVANAGSNLTITLPDNTVSLNGTSSFDPDGTISTYAWSQISGPSAATITGANTSTPTVSQLIVGQYVYQLTVTDNNGATNSDQVTITVNAGVAKVDQPPVANAGQSDTVTMPNNTYMLDASQSTDPDGTITSYQWQEIGGPNTVTSSTMNGAQVSISGLTVGQYEFQVTVTDNTGATATATMNLTVEPGLTSTDKLAVFPNPANNQIHEKITSAVTGTVKISVYDMNGRLVLSKQIDKSSETIYETMNVSSLASGMYTIQINIANQKTMVTKFIKN
ncbi:MAG TPA: PKD domain-containing protein [Puia sp.]|nr:PKD domain-containing protein [Puia sp.]